MKNLIKVFSFICILVIASFCHKDPPTPPIFTDQGNIGSQGGTVKTNDGASVEILEGALTTSQTISITNTTKTDTIINTGCRIYELKPDGLTFSDSIIITLPFDDKYIDLNSKEEYYGIGVRTLIDSKWMKLKMKINLVEKTAEIKSTHFSKYIIDYPNDYGNYFRVNKLNSGVIYNVPNYYQGVSLWCAYYSLSMVARSAGIYFKGPYFASLMGEGTYDNWLFSGLAIGQDIFFLTSRLDAAGIENDYVSPSWGNIENLCGYILKRLDEGYPVWVCSYNINHAFVVTGHSPNGFFVNDPSGAFLIAASGSNTWSPEQLGANLVSYDRFTTVINGTTSTLVIKSGKYDSNSSVSINFPPGALNIKISNSDGIEIGSLEINGKYSPKGYSLINNNSNNNSFNGTDFITIFPLLSNTESTNKAGTLHYIIDNKDKVDPLLVNTPPRNTIFNDFGAKTFQLNDLLKGNHILSVELRSSNEPNVIYDYWDFPFKIDNEYFVPASGTFIDYRDNNSYKWVKIKDQVWMAENLAYLPYVNISSSGSTTVPQYYVYDYEGTSVSEAKSSRNYNTYGALYNWAAANTVCPAGWHLSTYEDWDKLITYLGGENIAGGKLKNGNDPWGGFENYGATNDYGFSAGGSGIRATSDTMFIRLDPQGNYYNSYFSYQDNCAFWTSLDNFSSGDNNSAFFHALYGHSTRIDTYFDNKGWGFSVRCLKDN